VPQKINIIHYNHPANKRAKSILVSD